MVAIISLFISLLALAITAINCYMQYFYKKEEIRLTISDSLIEDSRLKVHLSYTNIGNQTNTITNVSIQLDTNERIHLERSNHGVRCRWIESFTLREKEQKCLIIYYPLPDFGDVDVCNISIRILTSYTNRKGKLYTDHFTVGQLYQNDHVKLAVAVQHHSHKLLGYENIQTLQ